MGFTREGEALSFLWISVTNLTGMGFGASVRDPDGIDPVHGSLLQIIQTSYSSSTSCCSAQCDPDGIDDPYFRITIPFFRKNNSDKMSEKT